MFVAQALFYYFCVSKILCICNMEDYSEYLIQGEPDKHDRVRNWMAAIGLQDVDGLTPSNYMLEAVRRNIEGESP